MKKILMSLGVLLVGGLLTGCGASKEDDKLNVVTTIFPYYDITSNVIGKDDNINLEMLLDSGTDLHSYQATTDDIIAINNADVIVLNGGESDEWILDAIENSDNKDLIVVNAMEELEDYVLEEEHKEGMEEHEHHHEDEDHDHEDEDHEHDHEDENHHDEEEHEHENDEHLWLSIKNVKVITEAIVEAMNEVNGNDVYTTNGDAYITKLDELDNEFIEVVKNTKKDTILVGDRFPFRYLVNDYNIDYYAAFAGCSTDVEASFETIMFLSKKLDELDLDYVLAIDGSNGSIANTIIKSSNNTRRKVMFINSMQSLGKSDIAKTSYLAIMEDNLEAIREVLK